MFARARHGCSRGRLGPRGVLRCERSSDPGAHARRDRPYNLKRVLERVNELRDLAAVSADGSFLRHARRATLPLPRLWANADRSDRLHPAPRRVLLRPVHRSAEMARADPAGLARGPPNTRGFHDHGWLTDIERHDRENEPRRDRPVRRRRKARPHRPQLRSLRGAPAVCHRVWCAPMRVMTCAGCRLAMAIGAAGVR